MIRTVRQWYVDRSNHGDRMAQARSNHSAIQDALVVVVEKPSQRRQRRAITAVRPYSTIQTRWETYLVYTGSKRGGSSFEGYVVSEHCRCQLILS